MRRGARLQSSKRGWLLTFSGFFGVIVILFTIEGFLNAIGFKLFSYEWKDILPVLFYTYPILIITIVYGWKIVNTKTKYELDIEFDIR